MMTRGSAASLRPIMSKLIGASGGQRAQGMADVIVRTEQAALLRSEHDEQKGSLRFDRIRGKSMSQSDDSHGAGAIIIGARDKCPRDLCRRDRSAR